MKFYSVKIGTRTRAGNLNVNYDFVAQSERNQSEVYVFYNNKYKGLAISVEEVTEIVNDEIPKKMETDFVGMNAETRKIQSLVKQITDLKEKGIDRFSSTIYWKGISDEVTEKLTELESLHNQYNTKKGEISKLIRDVVFGKYPMLKIGDVSIGEFSHNTRDIPYTVKLNGTLKYGEV